MAKSSRSSRTALRARLAEKHQLATRVGISIEIGTMSTTSTPSHLSPGCSDHGASSSTGRRQSERVSSIWQMSETAANQAKRGRPKTRLLRFFAVRPLDLPSPARRSVLGSTV
eukprot:scaffold109252_cov63-Phaeocystis_antarctica.AAC.2